MEEVAKRRYFENHYTNYEQWYDEHPREYGDQIEFLKKILPQGKGIEIGVGTGRFASALGIEFGIDYVPEMVETSRRKGIKAYLSDAAHLPFEDKSFDYSFSIVTMCFLDRPLEALKESRRIAKEVVTVILDKDCEYIQNIIRDPRGFYRYATFFSEKELVEIYKEAGFADLRVISESFKTSDGQEYKLVAVFGN